MREILLFGYGGGSTRQIARRKGLKVRGTLKRFAASGLILALDDAANDSVLEAQPY